ncbi:MAG: PAS domain S-box protein [Candidatus Omnitrophota bacterium]
MRQEERTKEELIEEIKLLQKRIAEIEKPDDGRKQAEEKLRASEKRFRALFEQNKDAIFVADPQTRMLLDCNLQAEKLTGRSREEILSMRADHLHPKEAVDEIMAVFKRQASGDDVLGESYVLTKDGQKTPVSINTAIIEISGKQYLVGTFRDITERKKAEEALREQEKLLNDVGDIAKIGGWEMDIETGRATWTKGTYDIVEIGYNRPIPGLYKHVDYYLPEYREMVQEKIERLIETRRPMQFEAELRTAKGNIKWCRAVGEALVKDGRVVKLRGTFQDITELKKIEEENIRHMHELEVFYKASVGREERIIELKNEVERLKKESGNGR